MREGEEMINQYEPMTLRGEVALSFAKSLFRPTKEETERRNAVMDKIDRDITITDSGNGFIANVSWLDLSFLDALDMPQSLIKLGLAVNLSSEKDCLSFLKASKPIFYIDVSSNLQSEENVRRGVISMCSVVPESAFQFTRPVLAYFEFEPNKDFNAIQNQEVQTQIRMGVAVKKSNTSPEATVDLTVEMGEKDGDSPFYIRAVEHANFRWKNDFDDKMVKNLLDQNAPTLLLSYLRPIIAQITAASTYESCDIPFVDFTQFAETKQE